MSIEIIQLVRNDPNWQAEFEQTKSCVLHATEGWVNAVEHIGGTSLPQSLARPSIDVIAGLNDLNGLDEAAFLIEGMNYNRRPLPSWIIGQPAIFLEKPRSGNPTHQVYLMQFDGPLWQSMLATREFFRSNPDEITRLSKAKHHIATQSGGDPESYAQSKSAYFSAVIDQIKSSNTP